MNLEQIMLENWKLVRKKFYFPNLPRPMLVGFDETQTASIDMRDHQIEVCDAFVQELHGKGLSYDTIFTGLLSHEIDHYLYNPYDLFRAILMDQAGLKVDENIGLQASRIYSDVCVNLDLILKKNVDEITDFLRVIKPNNPVMKVIKAYMQNAIKKDLGLKQNKLDKFLKKQVERLSTIDYFDAKNEVRNVKRFTRIIVDIMNLYGMKPEDLSMGMPGFGVFGEKAYDKNEIKKALKQLACSKDKDEFDKIVGRLVANGILPGNMVGDNKLRDIIYFENLAENYRPEIRKRKIHENGSMFPYSHKEYEIDDNPLDVDVFASLGKPFCPGLGKTWIKEQGIAYKDSDQVPNVLIIKDISGSMTHCEPYAEAACVATAKAYLENESKVGVYLFNAVVDDIELEKSFQTDQLSIFSGLTKSNNGGTVIDNKNLEKLKKIVTESEKELDIVVVSDLEISGLDMFFNYLKNLPDVNRVCVVYTGRYDVEHYQEQFNDADFMIYHVREPKDIPNIIIGEVNVNLK